MSASPADRAPSRTPNGTLPPIRRPKPPVDPLVRPKQRRPNRPPTASSNAVNGLNGGPYQNGPAIPGQPPTKVIQQRFAKPVLGDSTRNSTIVDEATEKSTSGFSSAPIAPYTDYPLVITKRQFMEGLRFHVARFNSKKNIDPGDEKEFTRPVRLHRRDARAPPGGGGGVKDENGQEASPDDKERARLDLLRAKREAEREAEMAKVAPTANSGNQKRSGASKKKTQQVFRNDQTEEQKAGTKLRYEEAIPWHLEDFDNNQTWVGSYEAALSETHASLMHKDGVFYLTPLEKWYKFAPKAPFSTLNIDEAEKLMGKKVKDPKWLEDQLKLKRVKQEEQRDRNANNKLFVGKGVGDTSGGRSGPAAIKREPEDAGELDFEEMQFADDEENQLFEGDEDEAKEAEKRIKKDQLEANAFGLKEEKEYEKLDKLEEKEKEARKKLGKKTRKALVKRERQYMYEGDDSDNPYSSEASLRGINPVSQQTDIETQSESSDTEAERLKEEQLKKEAADKSKDKPNSGSSSKGTNTPANRPSKHPDPLNRTTSSTSLKRPGSPNLSEASGNESSRKKPKKKHGESSRLNTGMSTPNGPPSRPRSPIPRPMSTAPDAAAARAGSQAPRKAAVVPQKTGSDALKRSRGGAGSGSEGETAGSGGEMSDGGRKRIKLKLSSPSSKNTSPRDSRAGSPDLPPATTTTAVPAGASANGSRAASPGKFRIPSPFKPFACTWVPSTSWTNSLTPVALTAPQPAPAPAPFPTAAELRTHIPASGTTVAIILKSFKGAIDSAEKKARFTEMLRTVSKYEKESKLLKPMD